MTEAVDRILRLRKDTIAGVSTRRILSTEGRKYYWQARHDASANAALVPEGRGAYTKLGEDHGISKEATTRQPLDTAFTLRAGVKEAGSAENRIYSLPLKSGVPVSK